MIIGFTASVGPVPKGVTPQAPLYQLQFAPAPNDPPATERILRSPGQTVEAELMIVVGSVERSSTRIVILAQLVVLQVPSARTK